MGNETILVTGATGRTGSRVARQLRNAGVPVRAASRSGEAHFDWNNRTTWQPALRQATGMYLVSTDLGSAKAADDITAFAREAAAAGVRRAVLASLPGGDAPGMEDTARAERALGEAGLETTVLRLRWLFQNFSEGFLREPLLSGDLRLPAGDGTEAFVDAEDIAAVAVTALTEPGHAGQAYELSGPKLLSFADAVADIAHATGRTIRYTPLTAEAYITEQRALGVPEEWVQLTAGMYDYIGSGAMESVTGDVAQVLGRPPRAFADYAREAAAQGAWNT